MVVLMLECLSDSMMKDNDTYSLFFSGEGVLGAIDSQL
jgi:hypothetical protein